MLTINQLISLHGWRGITGRRNSPLGGMYKISEIPQSIEERDLEKTVLDVFDKVDAPADTQNIEACQKLRPDNNCRNSKVRFSKRKDMV